MNTELIDTLSIIVENACKAESNIFGYGIWSHHIHPMVSIAQQLAQQLQRGAFLLCVGFGVYCIVSLSLAFRHPKAKEVLCQY